MPSAIASTSHTKATPRTTRGQAAAKAGKASLSDSESDLTSEGEDNAETAKTQSVAGDNDETAGKRIH